jgi:hypothetical protein
VWKLAAGPIMSISPETNHVYAARVYIEEGSWMVAIPELDGLTHAQNFR